MRVIRDCFAGQMQKIYHQAFELEKLTLLLQKVLPQPLASHCKVASFHKGILVIMTENAAWATQLRYQLTSLCDILRREGLYQLVTIKPIINVNQKNPSKDTKVELKPLSLSARQALLLASENCQHEPLQQALRQLANVNRNKCP